MIKQLEQAERQVLELGSELATLKQGCKAREMEFECAFEAAKGAWAIERAALTRRCAELMRRNQVQVLLYAVICHQCTC